MSNDEPHERSGYQSHMDDLLAKVSTIFDGENTVDAAHVAAACCAWAVHSSSASSEKRERLLEKMIEFLREEFRRMEDGDGRFSLQ
jgi:hypothetical protein